MGGAARTTMQAAAYSPTVMAKFWQSCRSGPKVVASMLAAARQARLSSLMSHKLSTATERPVCAILTGLTSRARQTGHAAPLLYPWRHSAI